MAKNDIKKRFGKRIRDLRKQQGLSQEGLADAIGIHRTYIGAVERGEQNISIENIERIAKELNVSLSDLFKRL